LNFAMHSNSKNLFTSQNIYLK